MSEQHTFGSLFAGVGGFDLGMEAAGWRCAWQVEWDKQCQQVLRYHWSTVPKYGDVTTVNGHDLAPVDCITFGSPCQDLSVAGKRAGLDGNRSGLFFEAVRIIEEMRSATGSVWPRWAIWENVVGALSSNRGHDFAAVLDSLAQAGAVLIEYAVLDAQHFGVPQRRRRVFVVACFDPATADRCPDPLLPVAESLPRDTAKKRTARQAAARSTAVGLGADSGIAGPLGSNRNGGHRLDLDNAGAYVVNAPTDDVVGTINGGGHPGSYNGQDAYSGLLVPVVPLQDGREIEKSQNGLGVGEPGDPMYTLDCTGAQSVAVVYEPKSLLDENWAATEVKAALQAGASKVCHVVVPAVWTKAKRAQSVTDDETWVEGEVAPTLNAFDQGDTRATVLAFGHTQGIDIQPSDTSAPTLRRNGGGAGVQAGAAVRRLTPVECERLMGWPDNHTAIGVNDSGDIVQLADSPRYRMIGNGVASPVAAWIGRHIRSVDDE